MSLQGDFFCKTCSRPLKGRMAGEHRKQGHDVWHLNVEAGEMTHRYGEKLAVGVKTPPITEDGHIKEQIKGYQKDGEPFVFIILPDGKIRDMRLEYPLLVPIYELAKKDLGYGGTFPQFLADGIETLFAAAGYELALAPRRQREVYDEVARLKREGKLSVSFDEVGLKLEVNHGDKAQGAEAGVGGPEHNHQSTGEEERGEEPGESE